jgi:hypothetical protein
MKYDSESMQDLFKRGWFTRTWTIQEVAMASAPLVMCGEKTILWGNLMGGFDIAFKDEKTEKVRYARSAVQCIEILWLCLLQKSWDDNDARFYNMVMTLFSAGSREETFRRFCALKKVCVRTLQVLVISMTIYRLYRGHWRLENSDWDAWLFVSLIFLLSFIMMFFDPPEEFANGRQHLLREALINNINLVRLRGATDLRDKVFALYGTFQALGIALDEPEYRHSTVADVYSRFARRIIEWQNNLDILIEASLPSFPGTPTWVPDLSREYYRWEVSHFKATGNSVPNFTHSAWTLRTTGLLVDVVTGSLQMESEWKFAFSTSKKGYKGFTPGSVLPDDMLVLISGLRVPMVLRRVREGYQVIGMADVQGIMDGEAWDDEISKSIFNLV